MILFYYILYCIILYRLYFIQWNLILLFPRNRIVYNYIVLNLIVSVLI
nr:MAG TPA: hypothetical protein [Caudoviricetes sp.]